jgi:ribose 5-phosphate isomerase A
MMMHLSPTQQNELKRVVGVAAADLVQPGMQLGLGTGSTTAYFISALIDRVHTGLTVSVMPSSVASERAAIAGRLPLLDTEQTISLDLYVDGADAVDPDGRLIKGGGGALLREKITAAMSKKFIVIVDASKHVPTLEGLALPVEILRYGAGATMEALRNLHCTPEMRLSSSQRPYLTDNGHWIVDIRLPVGGEDAERFAQDLFQIPGVMAHGLLSGMAQEIWTGRPGDEVERRVL